MKIDEHATHYVYGNGRFDLMTDEEVRVLTSDDFQSILVRLADLCYQGYESSVGQEIYHLSMNSTSAIQIATFD